MTVKKIMAKVTKKQLLYAGAGVASLFVAVRFGPRIVRRLITGRPFVQKDISEGTSVLIYDGECPVCRKSMGWIQRHAAKNSFEMLPCQSGERKSRYPRISEDICMKSVMLILPDGQILSGADTLPRIAERLKHVYSLAAYFFKLPGAMAFSHRFYRWFSDHRTEIAAFLFPRDSNSSAQQQAGRK